MIVSQDHSIWSEYGPKKVVLDQETVGTRYALLLLRTFLDPNDEENVKAAHALQDAVTVKQADKGKFEYPGWNKEEVEAMREKINVVAAALPDNTKTFGRKEDLDPIYWLLGAAGGWGGLPVQDVAYANGVPEKNEDGSATIHFGGDPGQDNFLPIVPGWNYIVRMYQPREEILEGNWKFSVPVTP